MSVYLIGTGCGPEDLTGAARRVLAGAGLVLGPRRLLDMLPAGLLPPGCEKIAAVRAADIAAHIAAAGAGADSCVLLSGDSGFYSGTRRLTPLLAGEDVTVLPGVSSVQALGAAMGRPWQDWGLFTAHGVECDPVAAVLRGKPAFFLTGGGDGPGELCRTLAEAGLGDLAVTVGENLGGPEERLIPGTAAGFAGRTFAPLNVLLAEASPRTPRRTPGLPDECFRRAEHVPMTKREVRALALALLAVGPEDICWDVGAGTGSVSVELALQAKAVYAVERNHDALALAEENRRALGAWNLRLYEGEAPSALAGLPAPDAVFVGGSGGRLEDILRAVHGANPRARICVAAIAVESLHNSITALEGMGCGVEVTQVAVSKSRAVGGLHMMTARNPVYLVTGAAEP